MSRILIISPDIEGPVINGGIGTAFTALADMLVQNNEDVDILYTSGRYSESTHGFEHWNTIYKEYRINLIQLAVDESLIIDAPHFRKQSYQTYLWLKDNDKYDKIIGCEWQGALYYTLLAKKQGLNFNNTEIIINTHGSSMWADEGNYSLPRDQNHLELYYLEQKCVELADSVVSPSAYLIQWMRSKKWKLPFNTKVIFNCEPSLIFRAGKHPIVNEDGNTEKEDTCYDGIELVFFGRLEIRKGLDLFIKSLKNFNLNNKNKISKITFMGKNIAIDGFDAMDFIDINMRSINLPYKVISHYNRTQANEYLKDRNVLVVIPSILDNSPYTVYECLISNVNFIASNVGGIAELIPEYAHDNILFELNPARLSDKIKLRLDNIDCKPGLIYSQCYINGLWLDAFSFCYINHALEVDEYNFPLVSVCITHHDRSELLQQAIASLRTQSYKNIEIILVDDGSVKEESYNYLNLLNDEFEKNNWKIITGENNYLGAARNLAAKHAKGDYLLFMDDDNVAKPCEIENFIKAAINTQADILTTPSDLIFDMEFPAPFRKMTHCWLPLGDDLNIAAFNNCFGDANALIKRSVFIDMGGFTEDVGVGHEDWEFFLKAVLKGYNLMVVPEALFWYRVSPSGMLLSGNKARNEFRSYRPFINDNLKYGLAMSMLPALLQQVDELKSQLEHASNNSMLIDVNNKVDALYSQQQFGWAHDRFMVLDNKLDVIKDNICNSNNHENTPLKILRKIKNMLTN